SPTTIVRGFIRPSASFSNFRDFSFYTLFPRCLVGKVRAQCSNLCAFCLSSRLCEKSHRCALNPLAKAQRKTEDARNANIRLFSVGGICTRARKKRKWKFRFACAQ